MPEVVEDSFAKELTSLGRAGFIQKAYSTSVEL